MAAKQGLSAQISQASEDAKRAVLQRTSLHNSLWFSNLNTTCTIKSAPPRTPDVLGLLSTKSGWLFKRNEQHVWQPRYCCVVPHTFLYYFDANPNNPCQTPALTSKQQEHLNKAVKQGYGKRGAAKQHQPRSSLYLNVLGGGPSSSAQIPPMPEDMAESTHPGSTLQPAGIIDLECYSVVHRNNQNERVLELAGDETVNPDLRSFYFCANSENEGEQWTQAFLGQRHSSLMDEKEAYRQVCDGFAQQLQVLHNELDSSKHFGDQQQEELYRVRSQMEDTRRSCLRLLQDTLERGSETTHPAKRAYRTDLETIQAQDLGIPAAVQVLCDYTRVLEETCSDHQDKLAVMEQKLEQKQMGDQGRAAALEEQLLQLQQRQSQLEMNHASQLETLQQKLIQAQKECQDVQKDLASQRMEMTMYQSSTRTKVNELQSHKKILKKEVIELRKKLEEAHSQLDVFRHKESNVKLEVEQERQKAKLLERYVEKMENQVKVQQNMMELMSTAGSQYGGASRMGHGEMDGYQFEVPSSSATSQVQGGRNSNASRRPSSSASQTGDGDRGNYHGNPIVINTPDSVHPDDEDEDDAPAAATNNNTKGKRPQPLNSSSRRHVSSATDDDAKSHMSELTEDRTQRVLDAAVIYQHQQQQQQQNHRVLLSHSSPRSTIKENLERGGPPAIIGVSDDDGEQKIVGGKTPKKLDTIMSTQPTNRPARRSEIPRYSEPRTPRKNDDAGSVSSYGTQKSKMSVAQRARLEADRHSTPVHVRIAPNATPLRGNRDNSSSHSRTPTNRENTSSHSLTTAITTPPPPPPDKERGNGGSVNGGSVSGSVSTGFFSGIGRRIENALDHSILGVMDDDDSDSVASTDIGTDVNTDVGTPSNAIVSKQNDSNDNNNKKKTNNNNFRLKYESAKNISSFKEEKKVSDTSSEASTTTSLTLAERQALQRAQQMRFLREQGLIQNDKDVRGGAGGTPSPHRPPTAGGGGLTSAGSQRSLTLNDAASVGSLLSFRRLSQNQ